MASRQQAAAVLWVDKKTDTPPLSSSLTLHTNAAHTLPTTHHPASASRRVTRATAAAPDTVHLVASLMVSRSRRWLDEEGEDEAAAAAGRRAGRRWEACRAGGREVGGDRRIVWGKKGFVVRLECRRRARHSAPHFHPSFPPPPTMLASTSSLLAHVHDAYHRLHEHSDGPGLLALTATAPMRTTLVPPRLAARVLVVGRESACQRAAATWLSGAPAAALGVGDGGESALTLFSSARDGASADTIVGGGAAAVSPWVAESLAAEHDDKLTAVPLPSPRCAHAEVCVAPGVVSPRSSFDVARTLRGLAAGADVVVVLIDASEPKLTPAAAAATAAAARGARAGGASLRFLLVGADALPTESLRHAALVAAARALARVDDGDLQLDTAAVPDGRAGTAPNALPAVLLDVEAAVSRVAEAALATLDAACQQLASAAAAAEAADRRTAAANRARAFAAAPVAAVATLARALALTAVVRLAASVSPVAAALAAIPQATWTALLGGTTADARAVAALAFTAVVLSLTTATLRRPAPLLAKSARADVKKVAVAAAAARSAAASLRGGGGGGRAAAPAGGRRRRGGGGGAAVAASVDGAPSASLVLPPPPVAAAAPKPARRRGASRSAASPAPPSADGGPASSSATSGAVSSSGVGGGSAAVGGGGGAAAPPRATRSRASVSHAG